MTKNLSENLVQRAEERGGQAHFAPKTPQNEPVPGGFGIGSKRAIDWGHSARDTGEALALASARIDGQFVFNQSVGSRPPLASRRGLTLLELILALSLSIVIVYAIGMAIHLNLRVLEARRSGIEKAQLARAILQLIANDLRSAVQYETQDFSEVDELVSELSTELEDPTAQADEEEPTEEEEPSGQVVSSPTPGLIGYQYELHVDVSRLPRPDQYNTSMTPSSNSFVATDIPSDVKTVSYFLQTPNPMPATGGAAAAPASNLGQNAAGLSTSTGLIRRELDRAVTAYAMELGDMSWLQQSGKVVAPEVAHIEFLYFDGIEWLTEWDSNALQSLPQAVDIRMILQMDEQRTPDLLSPQLSAQPVGDRSFYRMVVHLPAAAPKSEEELLESQSEMEEEQEEDEEETQSESPNSR